MFGTFKSDWKSVEGAENWDPFAKKHRYEPAWKIGHQLHGIFRARIAKKGWSTIKHLRAYGPIFGEGYVESPMDYVDPRPPSDLVDGEEEYEVDKILD
ncbi:hypothetical protein BGW38_009552 [Lunasporangiospora selenospora]|uniref:Uncharacterized protein n=1 Tax=Lunasporangiospora selenospora TaxID=979761 RepID=A0A9P6FZ82_9FUNG|nr:hypothetical protein BGW38_009552 [Lunasporangiospora selenospora]